MKLVRHESKCLVENKTLTMHENFQKYTPEANCMHRVVDKNSTCTVICIKSSSVSLAGKHANLISTEGLICNNITTGSLQV